MKFNNDALNNLVRSVARKGIILLSAGLMLAACDKIPDMPSADSRPKIEIEGTLSAMMLMGTFDPNRGRLFGPQMVTVEYKPGQEAIIYTSPETEFVNFERRGNTISYMSGSKYRLRGYETKPVALIKADGNKYYPATQGADLWLEVTYIELLETKDQQAKK